MSEESTEYTNEPGPCYYCGEMVSQLGWNYTDGEWDYICDHCLYFKDGEE